MQCPVNEKNRCEMFNEIRLIDNNFDERSRQSPGEAFFWLMGKRNQEIDADKMVGIWITAGFYVTAMYRRRLSLREGIG